MSSRGRAAALGAVGLLVIALLGLVGTRYVRGDPPFGQGDDAWSGVFLTNGQAYFGHLSTPPGGYARLREVYYVLATQLQSQDQKVPAQTQLSLQKLGGEVHGPTSEMRLANDQILFIEELRPDSPLVAAIAQLKAGGGAAPVAPTLPATPSPAPATPASASPSPTPSPKR